MNIEEGVIIRPDAHIGVGATIKCYAILGRGVWIGENSYIGPGAKLLHMTPSGESKPCIISDNVFVGAGAIVCPDVTIAEDVIIGAGSVVTKTISEKGTYAGNPCKKLR